MVVSVPTKVTHLLYRKDVSQKGVQMYVSVPTKGTHLLYNGKACYEKYLIVRFRPHEGDPSSLHLRWTLWEWLYYVSVPTKGTHLLYM